LGLPEERRVLVVCALLAFSSYILSGCSRESETFRLVALRCVVERPERVGQNTVTCKLSGEAQKPVSGARISLEGNMSHAGMSPTFGEAKEKSPGTYTGAIDLNMRGDWVVTVHVVMADNAKLDQEINVHKLEAN
jgi:hypothetical protein